MAIEWIAGNRIRGTSTERTTTSGFTQVSAVSGGWKELGRTTLGSNGDDVTVSSLADKRYYMILTHITDTGQANNRLRMGYSSVDSGSNYAYRNAVNGGSDGPSTTTDRIDLTQDPADDDKFSVSYISNLSGKEKLAICHSVERGNNSGAGNVPARIEAVGKWVNTSNPLDVISHVNTSSGSYTTGTECVVLGYDPDDTHSDNFWEELADVTLGSDASEISSGTITAKKYLWVQVYFHSASNSNDVLVRFNNDTGSNYAHRHAINYGSDTTQTSGSSIKLIDRNSTADTGRFVNFFAINNSANEKLLIAHGMEEETSGAGNPPTSNECVAKWANTSSQITEIDCFTESGNLRSGARLRVWGSN